MFLSQLNSDEKGAFLKLAHYIARCDGDFSEAEVNTISTYCIEMQIEDIEYNDSKFDLESILNKFKSEESRKIVLLEIMALIYSDGLEEREQKILDKMVEVFNLAKELEVTYSEWTQSILKISAKGYDLIYS